MSTVVIVIPVYKTSLSLNESTSLRQCLRMLGKYPIILVGPKGMSLDSYKTIGLEYGIMLQVHYFNQAYFRNLYGYNSLLLSKKFYRTFKEYAYLLIYQLDAFVFEDNLDSWCTSAYDYVGSPWYANFSNEIIDEKRVFEGVGNGGFSLRKTNSHIQILKHKNKALWLIIRKGKKLLPAILSFVKVTLYDLFFKQVFFQEDIFLFRLANMYPGKYKIPEPMEALSFGFELQPARSYKLNGYQLPFGCHAWWKYDLQFWKPHIEKFGYTIDLSA